MPRLEASFRPDLPHDTALLRPAPAGLQTLAGLGFPHPPLHRPFLWPARVLSLNESGHVFSMSRALMMYSTGCAVVGASLGMFAGYVVAPVALMAGAVRFVWGL